MLKVVFVGHRDLYYGAESVMFRIMIMLKNKEIAEPLLVLPKSRDEGFSKRCKLENLNQIIHVQYKLIGGSFFRSLLCLIYNFPALIKLYFYYRNHEIDVIYTNTSVNIMGPLLSLLLKLPHIWHFHEQPTSGKFKWIPPGLFPLFRFLLNRRMTTVVFVSNTQKSLWEKEFGFQIRNSKVIYTPAGKAAKTAEYVSSVGSQFDSAMIAQDTQYIPAKETVTFGFLGSWTPSKNLLSLLTAFAKLRTSYPKHNTRMVLMGGGEMESRIISQIKALGIQKMVTLMPHSKDLRAFFLKINIFVLPSWFESWGLAALEAVQHKKALVITSNSALTEILKPHVDCLYTDPYQEDTLYQAMEHLLLHPEDRIKMANHAYHTLQSLNLDTQFERAIVSLFKQHEVP
jgi:glycosyltransferase involved in cell wall biosynthesis